MGALDKLAPEIIGGGDKLSVDLTEQIAKATGRLSEIVDEMVKAKDEQSDRYQTLKEESEAMAETLTELKTKHDAEVREAQIKAVLDSAQEWRQTVASLRSPSKAHLLGGGRFNAPDEYRPGAFLASIAAMDPNIKGWSPEGHTTAKATLEALTRLETVEHLRSKYGDSFAGKGGLLDGEGKATLGTTDATGGWIVPNALVEEIVKPVVQTDPYRQLVTVREGVTSYQIDQPWRSAAPARMVVAARGATKENVDLTYNGYTVTMYTLARIHDLANQFLRTSSGAAERDVLEELASAATIAERYYIMEGSGSSEPYGIATALTNSAYSDEITHTPATSLAGSVAAAVNIGAENLATRSVIPNAAVMHPSVFWLALRQGDDQAGFYFPQAFDGSDPFRNPVRAWGIPLFFDANLAGTDDLIVGNFKSVKVYFGDTFRIDSSSVAGNRWDENETGFRGEFEMGLDARPAVYTGNFTRSTDVTP